MPRLPAAAAACMGRKRVGTTYGSQLEGWRSGVHTVYAIRRRQLACKSVIPVVKRESDFSVFRIKAQRISESLESLLRKLQRNLDDRSHGAACREMVANNSTKGSGEIYSKLFGSDERTNERCIRFARYPVMIRPIEIAGLQLDAF